MKFTLLALLPSLILARIQDNPPRSTQLFNPHEPIYLGEIFWPPTMTFLAFLPPTPLTPSDTYWCHSAMDVTNHALFSLGGLKNLRVENYFEDAAYISREGLRWADCRITPESGRMGACQAVKDWDCEGGHRFTGPGTRKWSCWVNDLEGYGKEREGKQLEQKRKEEILARELTITDENVATKSKVNGAVASSSLFGAFTPGVTATG